jgi:CheY-like chemotaxis protein
MLQGRKVALVGLAEQEGADFIELLQQDGATCQHNEHGATQTINSSELVILRAGGSVLAPAAERTLLESCARPVLVLGAEEALQPLAPLLRKAGRSFVVYPCPASEVRLRVAMLLPATGEVQARQTIVIADDDRVTRAMIEAWLVKEGFTCHSAGDGEEALSLTRRLRPAAVILDLYMPRRNGLAVLKEIREDANIAGTRVLMLTGSAEQENVRRASALHADGYLVKPFQAAKLMERIKTLLARAA